jgi:hypothetical protein
MKNRILYLRPMMGIWKNFCRCCEISFLLRRPALRGVTAFGRAGSPRGGLKLAAMVGGGAFVVVVI